eukprot:6299220-Prymnesium_polylepis.2
MSLIKFLVLTLVLAHWLACFWGFLGNNADTGTPIRKVGGGASSWIERAGLEDADPLFPSRSTRCRCTCPCLPSSARPRRSTPGICWSFMR